MHGEFAEVESSTPIDGAHILLVSILSQKMPLRNALSKSRRWIQYIGYVAVGQSEQGEFIRVPALPPGSWSFDDSKNNNANSSLETHRREYSGAPLFKIAAQDSPSKLMSEFSRTWIDTMDVTLPGHALSLPPDWLSYISRPVGLASDLFAKDPVSVECKLDTRSVTLD